MTTDPVRTDRIMARYWGAIPEIERADIEARVPDGWWVTLTIGRPSGAGVGTARLIDADGDCVGEARGVISAQATRCMLRERESCNRVLHIPHGI